MDVLGYILLVIFILAIITKAWLKEIYNADILGLFGKELIKSRILNIITTTLCFGYIICMVINKRMFGSICIVVFVFIELYEGLWRGE